VDGSDRGGGRGRRLTRREALRWLALRAGAMVAGAAGVGAIVWLRPWARASGGIEGEAAFGRTLVARPSTRTEGGVQVFRSRPDLRPPAVRVNVPPAAAALGGFILTDCHYGPGQQGPIILDRQGGLVWFEPLSAHGTPRLRAFNLEVQTYRGAPVLAYWRGRVVNGHGEGWYVLKDHGYRTIAEVHAQGPYEGDLHEFVLTPEGTALFTCYGTATADLTALGGAKDGRYYNGVVQEVEIATGRLLFEWRSDDHVPLDDSYVPVEANSPVPWDYFHVNSIGIDPSDGNLVISGRNTWAFYKVDRRTGAVLWRVGGKASDFAVPKEAHFAFQHDVKPRPGGVVTIFDNEAGPPAEASQSRGLVIALDEAKRPVRLVTEYRHKPPVLAYAEGNVQDLNEGHRFIGWGDAPDFTEFDAAGRVLFDAGFWPSTKLYRAFKQAWRGQPATAPDIAVERKGTAAIVYASWNGATEVTRWAILGGGTATALRPMGTVERAGFETAIEVSHAPAYLAVEALDAAGKTLARSAIRAVPD
jgi:hypothetical protein